MNNDQLKNKEYGMRLYNEAVRAPKVFGVDNFKKYNKFMKLDEDDKTEFREKEESKPQPVRIITKSEGKFLFKGDVITGLNPSTAGWIIFNYLYEKSITEPLRTVIYRNIINELERNKDITKISGSVSTKTIHNALEDLCNSARINDKQNDEFESLIVNKRGIGYLLNNKEI